MRIPPSSCTSTSRTYAGLLAAAAARRRITVFGEDAYPTVEDKAAALLHSLVSNHALVDGNKRLAWSAARIFCAFVHSGCHSFLLTADPGDLADRHSSGLTNAIESKTARASFLSAGLIDSSGRSSTITARSPFRSTAR